MNDKEIIQEKAIQTAFCWTRYQYYGSEANAVKSLLKRKGIKGISATQALEEIKRGLAILKETEILAKSEPKKKEKTFASSEDELNSYAATIREVLKVKFPDVSEKVLDYAIGMIVLMPYYR